MTQQSLPNQPSLPGAASASDKAYRLVHTLNEVDHGALILEHAGDLVSLHDPAGCWVSASPSYHRVLGYDFAELTGESIFDFIHADDRSAARHHWQRGLDQGEEQATFRCRHANGAWRWMATHIRRTERQGLPLVVCVARDITEWREIETALHESEARYHSLVKAAAQIVWSARPDGQMVDIPQWRAFTGQSVADSAGWGWLDALHPDDRSPTFEAWTAAVATRQTCHTEYRLRRHDGNYRWFSARAVPVVEPDGRLKEWIGICTDIDDHKQDQRRQEFLVDISTLLYASLEYETTLTNLAKLMVPFLADSCSVYTISADGSPRWLEGGRLDPALAEQLQRLRTLDPLDAESRSPVAQVLRSGAAQYIPEVTSDLLQQIARGPEHLAILQRLGFTSMLVVPLVSREHLLGALVLCMTRSRRRYTPTDLSVAEEVARRAALAIDNAQLYSQAQQALRARDEFVSIAAHELKTPVTGILGHVQLIQKRLLRAGVLDEHNQQGLQTLAEQTHRLARLIHTMLDISRIQLGSLMIERRPLDLVALIERMVAETPFTAPSHTVSFHAAQRPLLVPADAQRIEQVVENLLQNAIKYSDPGGQITVQVARVGDDVRLTITDEGIGIPDASRERLFERFYRAKNATNMAVGGLGIGLYVVNQIVTLHGGTVGVDSQEGIGSTFTVTLPATL